MFEDKLVNIYLLFTILSLISGIILFVLKNKSKNIKYYIVIDIALFIIFAYNLAFSFISLDNFVFSILTLSTIVLVIIALSLFILFDINKKIKIANEEKEEAIQALTLSQEKSDFVFDFAVDEMSDFIDNFNSNLDLVKVNRDNVINSLDSMYFLSKTSLDDYDVQAEKDKERTSLTIFDKTIELMYTLDKSIENTVKEMRSQSQILKMTFEVFDITTLSMEKVDEITQKAKTLAKELSEVAKEGTNAVERTALAISNMEKDSKHMGDIVNLIQNISAKTNLLSMNAAIEAAKAGERGKGFSIVAQEIRKLAQNTAKSTEEITQIIKNISAQIVDAVEQSKRTEEIFSVIKTEIDKTNNLNEEIYKISRKNVIQGKEIQTAVNQVQSIGERVMKQSQNEYIETHDVIVGMNEVNSIIAMLIVQLKNVQDFLGEFYEDFDGQRDMLNDLIKKMQKTLVIDEISPKE